jgi:hypothetical protein
MHWLLAIGLLILYSVMQSTPEGRREAEVKLAKYNPLFLGITLVIVGLFVFG